MGFALDINGFTKKTGIHIDQIVRKVCLDLTRDLVMACPVKTGLARSNFFFGVDRSASVGTDVSKNGRPSIERSSAFASNLNAGGVFYITNNLPYILPIMQYGTSVQMATGGLTRIVSRWQQIVDKAAKMGSRSDRVDDFRGVE